MDYFCQNKLDEISNKELIIDLPFKNYKFSNQTKVLYRVLGQTNIKEAELFNDKEYKVYKNNIDNIEKINFLTIDKKQKNIKFKKGSWVIKNLLIR